MKIKLLYFYDADNDKQFVGAFTDELDFQKAFLFLKEDIKCEDEDIEIEEYPSNVNLWN